MKILVVANTYPNRIKPNYGSFVYNLLQEVAKENSVTVISPYKFYNFLSFGNKQYGDESCKVIRPVQLSFGNKKVLGFDFNKASGFFYSLAVKLALYKIKDKPDVIYCHFLLNSIPILNYANKFNIPVVVASGESSYQGWGEIDSKVKELAKKTIRNLICVSNSNKNKLVDLGFDTKKISVIPNAVNKDLFKPSDKTKSKAKLGYSERDFIVGFVGHFINRKGPNRIIAAIEKLNDPQIKLVCVGNGGELIPSLFTKVIEPKPNHMLPDIYNAFDVFVLPTLSEGHCNAIEEAKACAIPIISSLGTSVEEQVNENFSILVDPLDIDSIAKSIALLKKNEELLVSYTNYLKSSDSVFCISERSMKVRRVMESSITKS